MKKITKPIYVRIYEDILNDIENGIYPTLEKLPSENIFAEKFGVNRHTVRQALQLLKEKGVIYSKQGKGNFITNIEIPYSITTKSSYSSVIYDLGYEPQSKIVSAKIIHPNDDVAKALGINKKLQVIEIKLLRYANGIPITFSVSYFDAFCCKDILKNLDFEPFSLYKALEKTYPEIEITKLSTVFKAMQPTKEISEMLKIPLNAPVLAYSTISVNQNGEYLEYGTSYSRGDSCRVKVNLV